MKYYISKNNDQTGPFSVDEILELLSSNEIAITDFFFNEKADDWQPLFQLESVAQAHLKKSNKPAPPKMKPLKIVETTAQIVAEPKKLVPAQETAGIDWFIFKNDKNFGPFNYDQLLTLLCNQTLFEYDYVYNDTLPEWKQISELEVFQMNYMEQHHPDEAQKIALPQMRRASARHSIHSKLFVHNDEQIWKGQSLDISKGGCALVIENSHLLTGTEVKIHFSGNNFVAAFNVVGKIVSKNEKENGLKDTSPTRYGVEFIQTNPHASEILKKIS